MMMLSRPKTESLHEDKAMRTPSSNQRAVLRIKLSLGLAIAIGSVAVLAGPPESAPGAAIAAAHRSFPQVSLPTSAYGENAIAGLGGKLPDIAAWYGKSTAEFARLLREDSSVWIDRKGRVFYIEQFPQAGQSNATDPLQPGLFPLSETFTLNSRPGSKRVIYLDFDGQQTTGTAWNASYGSVIDSPAYSLDSDSAFSTQELQNIQYMWKQVAEDYAPFDVNVTTQDPGVNAITRSGSSDEYYGTRVVVTVDNFANCGCGGFAYLTAYNDTSDYYKPAFVFNKGLVGAGEAISHEVGHNLGLHHDGGSGGVGYYTGHGSGATGWAPIMGVGYYQLLVQWSKGEYTGANNQEDDITVIQSYGAPLMTDDHGDTTSTATPLDAVSNGSTVNLVGTGMIRLRSDVDMFSFVAGAGSYSISVHPAPFSPNLDIQARLYNGSGNLLATANPGDSLPATLSGNLSAGSYFVSVDGIGKGDPLGTGYSDYGSLGRYAISGQAAASSNLAAPVAVASAPTYTSIIAPAYVGFDGSASSDSDGTIDGWYWDFGDGNTASGELVNHTYNSPGSYMVTLTVTDDDGLSANDSLTIVVLNQAPIALANADTTSGTAPLTLNFSSADSSDPDSSGSITAYLWLFGDGASSTEPNPKHTYNSAGQFTATLTVTDNLGASDTATLLLEVAAPPVLVQYASGEQTAAGSTSGSYLATQTADGNEESIQERESGGRKTNRYSYLEHTWLFNLVPGNSATLFITGRQTTSTDGDDMLFAYSINGGDYMNLGLLADANGAALPTSGGDVRIRVTDSDRTVGNLTLDSVYIDQISIVTETQAGGSRPNPAALLNAMAVSANQIDLDWSDNSGDEFGFRIERSTDNSTWSTAGSVAANQTTYSDNGLQASTEYFYLVFAYNGEGDAVASNTSSARTAAIGAISLSASGSKPKGVQHVFLTWTGLTTANVFRDGVQVATSVISGYDDNIRVKGAGSYTYKVCSGDITSNCSNEANVSF